MQFLSFIRTAEGTSLITDVYKLAALFPPHERYMLQCADELEAIDREEAREAEEAATREPPAVDAYVEARRELDGTGLMLDLAELLEAFTVPVLPPLCAVLLEDLRRAAFDIVAWATVRPLSPSSVIFAH